MLSAAGVCWWSIDPFRRNLHPLWGSVYSVAGLLATPVGTSGPQFPSPSWGCPARHSLCASFLMARAPVSWWAPVFQLLKLVCLGMRTLTVKCLKTHFLWWDNQWPTRAEQTNPWLSWSPVHSECPVCLCGIELRSPPWCALEIFLSGSLSPSSTTLVDFLSNKS